MKTAKIISAVMVMAMLTGASGCSKDNGEKDTKETASEIETEVEITSESTSMEQITDKAADTTADTTAETYYLYNNTYEGILDPDTTIFEHGAIIYGTEITLPCTLGDLKALGYEPNSDVSMGELNMHYVLNGEAKFTIYVKFEDPELEVDEEDVKDLSDDMTVVAIYTYGEAPQYEFNGVKNGMTEEEVLSILGIPAFVYDIGNMGKAYYYKDKAGNIYCFSFMHFIGEAEPIVLKTIDFGAPDRLTIV